MPLRPLELREQLRFAGVALPEHGRVLEVGCGDGDLALALARQGHPVVGLDRRLLRPLPVSHGVTWVEGDFLHEDLGHFDALVFASSLHHIAPLESAIEAAGRSLKLGGLLLVDDFDLGAPDPPTLRWYYQVQDDLKRQGLFQRSSSHLHDAEPGEPQPSHSGDDATRWRDDHLHHGEPPLHTGTAMLGAIGSRFEVSLVERGPYLFRYICGGLPDTEEGERIAERVWSEERAQITSGAIKPVGLRVRAVRRKRSEGELA